MINSTIHMVSDQVWEENARVKGLLVFFTLGFMFMMVLEIHILVTVCLKTVESWISMCRREVV